MGTLVSPTACARARRGVWLASVLVGLALGPAAGRPAAAAQQSDLVMKAMVEAAEPIFEGLHRKSPRYFQVRDGWLAKGSLQAFRFFNPEPFGDPPADTADRLATVTDAIVDTRRQLDELGIELLVVPLPTRINLYPEALCDIDLPPNFAGFAPGTANLIEKLREGGVEVLDVMPLLAAQRGAWTASNNDLVYLRVNAHWSPKGMAIAADAVAEHVRSRPWFEAPEAVRTRIEVVRERWEPDVEWLPEGVEPPVLDLERIVDLEGASAERTDVKSPIMLWGDSFTNIYTGQDADLARHLGHRLGRPLDVIASPGGGADAARMSFARRRKDGKDKRLVIWIFASRAVLIGEWNRLPLDRG